MTTKTKIITKRDFNKMTPFQKGYAVYLFGANDDYPAVPAVFVPTLIEKEQYQAGQQQAMLDAQESEE